MQIGSSALQGRRWVLVALVALLGLTVACATNSASASAAAHARIAKKCKKGKKSAVAAKKKCKKKKAVPAPPAPPPPPPAPLALTDSEVIARVAQKAGEYCAVDSFCYDYGYYGYPDLAHADCSSKSTYSWTCYGWNDEYDGVDFYTCDFREVVDRVGYNGITSHQDLTFGTSGWSCF
jgi:hypothetical protein